MSSFAPNGDGDLLELLRLEGPMVVSELAGAIQVTATAVRQRLNRLMAQGLIQREAIRAGRGRPKHRYRLTQKGLRLTGSNFVDLALALWQEIGAIEDAELRQTLLGRVVKSLAGRYARQIEGQTVAERMQSLSKLLGRRRVPFTRDETGELPVLTAHACPYPELAEADPGICALEQMLFSELLGRDVELSQCRLNGESRCRFQPS